MCIWNVEADIFDFKDEDIIKNLYTNAPISRFLSSKDSMGISACKGMGKTYLLKIKRLQMIEDSHYLTLPKDCLLDTSGPIILSKMHMTLLSSYNNWVSLWISCIAIYLLSLKEINENIDLMDLEDFPPDIKLLIAKKNTGIFNVLHRILAMKDKAKLNLFIQYSPLLFDMLKSINRPIAIFVDKLEEPFNRGFYPIPGNTPSSQGHFNASIWSYCQLAFAEAVYKIYSARHHIKIFYSIRQESLYGAEAISVEYSKLLHRIVELTYTYEDLQKMFNLYILNESDEGLCFPSERILNPQRSFVGFNAIPHRTGIDESVWAYMHRHSLQRPRDIMEMGMAIYREIVVNDSVKNGDSSSKMRVFRHWVNQVSTTICRSYISFLQPFMSHDDNIQFAQKIFNSAQLLQTNIFTSESMQFYCHEINNNPSLTYNCKSCENLHFFSTLYNIGLLGCIYKSVSEHGYKNKIKHIGSSVFDSKHQSLPEAVLYYVHPGFANIIQSERELSFKQYIPSYLVVNSSEVFVAEHRVHKLRDFDTSLMGNWNNNKVFLCSTGNDIPTLRKRIYQLLRERGYSVMAYEEPDFPSIDNSFTKKHPNDHCIDIMLTCKHVVYIFTGRFGGKYHGEKYKCYIEDVNRVIKEIPSISFMEYLVAKGTGKNVKIYVDEKVKIAKGEYLSNESNPNYKSSIVDSIRVFKQLDYFNSLGNSTWFDTYSNELDLEKYIEAHFPVIPNSPSQPALQNSLKEELSMTE